MNASTRGRYLELEDAGTNKSANPSIHQVLSALLSRRAVLKGALGAAASSFFGMAVGGCGGGGQGSTSPVTLPPPPSLKLNFLAIAKAMSDRVLVPPGHSVTVLLRLGDPLTAGVPPYRNDGTDTAQSHAQRAGDFHDGIHYFGLGSGGWSPESSARGLLVMNHESIVSTFLHPSGPTVTGGVRAVPDEVLKEMYAHGICVVEISRAADGGWSYKQDSQYNRRIHALTDIILSGPAAKTGYMVTRHSPTGARTRGTVNNCAHGATPWGTYLGCEENHAGFFRRFASGDPDRSAKELASFSRYGVGGAGRELWASVIGPDPEGVFARWNAMKLGASADGSDDYRNGPNTFGWNVEVDPFDPLSIPRKRTAMGRLAHEGAWLGLVRAGEPLVWYMGDDSQGEYIYKFVSNAVWDPNDANRGLAAGDKYLDDGRLFVARFDPDGTGQWLELRLGVNNITSSYAPYAFADQADVLVNARFAADAAGATRMDRPEWGSVNPLNGDVYMSLTNNSASVRNLASIDPANPRFYNDRRTGGQDQIGNPNGHIIRWAETDARNASTSFRWDIFLFGARASVADPNINVSSLTNGNDFSSPDGLWFDRRGVLWIQTDDSAYTDVTNCMMLACLPGSVGDGSGRTIVSVSGTNSRTVATKVGAPASETNLRRFLVGPNDCEITGVTQTPDGKTLFVNIQHPGAGTSVASLQAGAFTSNWPDGPGRRPRSATIVITRDDGGEIGASLS